MAKKNGRETDITEEIHTDNFGFMFTFIDMPFGGKYRLFSNEAKTNETFWNTIGLTYIWNISFENSLKRNGTISTYFILNGTECILAICVLEVVYICILFYYCVKKCRVEAKPTPPAFNTMEMH